MSSRRIILALLLVVIIALGTLFLVIRPNISTILPVRKPIDTTQNEEPQKPDSPFGELITPLEGDDLDKLLASRMEVVDCAFPENAASSVTTSGIVPGIKEDATSLDDYWILNSLQPIILSYETFNDTHYFIGGLRDDSGNCKKIAFVLAGNFNIADESGIFNEDIITILGADPPLQLSFEEFSTKYPVGTQLRVYYLGRRPESNLLVPDLCNVKPPVSQRYCTVQRVSELYSKRVMDRKLLTEVFSFPSELDQIYAIYLSEKLSFQETISE